MIKRLRVTVDGNSYDVTVEISDETSAAPATLPPVLVPPPVPAVPTVPLASAPTPKPAAAPAPSDTSAAPAGPGDVPSPLSGRVTAVVVTVGQEVKEGDHLLTLEAMKMNTFVFAPRTGKVTAIKTEVGGVVDEGQVLVQIG